MKDNQIAADIYIYTHTVDLSQIMNSVAVESRIENRQVIYHFAVCIESRSIVSSPTQVIQENYFCKAS
jgi:hypothetical protein